MNDHEHAITLDRIIAVPRNLIQKTIYFSMVAVGCNMAVVAAAVVDIPVMVVVVVAVVAVVEQYRDLEGIPEVAADDTPVKEVVVDVVVVEHRDLGGIPPEEGTAVAGVGEY